MSMPSVQWISAQWLKNNLSDITLIDSQPDIHDYIQVHIPGAVYLNQNHFHSYHLNLPTRYSPAPCIELLLQQTGVQQNKPVVVYSSKGSFSHAGDGLEQTMVAYSLLRFGHCDVFLLNGGLQKWIDANYPKSKSYPLITPSKWKYSICSELFINYNQFSELRKSPDTVVIDVRPRAVYEGKSIWSKPGHIPGAISLPWPTLMDHHNPMMLRPLENIRETALLRGAVPHKTIILYCGTGREATSSFLVFKYLLNYPHVKLYEGSFTEWCSIETNPTTLGIERVKTNRGLG